MNKKQKMAIIILSIFIIGMCIGAVDAAHTVQKGKYKVKLTNKEYKKLTGYKTKYKTVNKTTTVTKNVTKYKTIPNYTYTYEPTYNYYYWAEHTFTSNESYKVGDIYDENYKITAIEDNSYKEPYTATVTEKVTKKVKVPYKVRNDATVTKKIKGKYRIVKEPIYKTVKVKKTGYKWKYVKSSVTIYRADGSISRNTQYAVDKPKGYTFGGLYNDWVSDREVHTYLRYNKKVTYYTKKKVIKGYKKVKKPLKMTISSYDGLKKGKVFCELWSEAGIESAGKGTIK